MYGIHNIFGDLTKAINRIQSCFEQQPKLYCIASFSLTDDFIITRIVGLYFLRSFFSLSNISILTLYIFLYRSRQILLSLLFKISATQIVALKAENWFFAAVLRSVMLSYPIIQHQDWNTHGCSFFTYV